MAAACLFSASVGRTGFFGSKVPHHVTVVPRRSSATHLVVTAGWGTIPKYGPGRKWEHAELTKNGKPVFHKVHVKTGDTVQVIAGKDKGKVSKVTEVDKKHKTVIVEGVNMKTKHVKPKTKEEQGQIKVYEFPIDSSNVMHFSAAKQVRSRVGHKVTEDGKKVRYLIKTGEVLDN